MMKSGDNNNLDSKNSDLVKKKQSGTQYTNRNGVIEYKQNPFAQEMLETIKTGNRITGFASKSAAIYDKETGESLGDSAVIGIKKRVDKEEFIKFFGAGLVSAFELSKTAQDMFILLMRQYLEVNTAGANAIDQIYINYAVAVDEAGYKKTRQTFSNGINQLIQKKFMAPIKYKKDWYWLNPNLFIKGDRIRLIQEYEVYKPEEEQLDLLENTNHTDEN